MEWVKIFSPGTLGNIGPGFDVLGLAIKGVGDIITARKCESGVTISSIESKYELSSDPRKNTAGIAASAVLDMLDIQGGIELKIKKGLPIGSGLGSSAASAAAAAFATNHLYGDLLSREELILPATKAEESISGGFFADNTAPSLLGGATLTRCCLPLDVTKIGSINKLKIVVVSPEIVILTRKARKILPKKVLMRDFVFNMGNSCLITAAFVNDDYKLFARCLNDRVIEPVRAKLIPGFYRVKKSAIEAGSNGATISGSGPTVFAITDELPKARFIQDAMVRTFKQFGIKSTGFITEVDPIGTRIINN